MSRAVRRSWIVVGALGALTVAVAFTGVVTDSDPLRVGQIVFVPGQLAPSRGAPDVGRVTVARCEETRDGLVVQGRVEPSEHVTAIVVAPGEPQMAGLAVSAAFATSTGRVPGAQPGDFVVTLGWASRTSTFAVVDAESLGGGFGSPVVGPSASCPEVDGSDDGGQASDAGALSSTQSPSRPT